ncbi:putative GTP-binding protein EngB [Frankliniella fusca]|uniref:GTP-binding protein EngB n=1 Tax=Frankliniella fusca TaxID=407009 RepID=A0AAE1HEX8_9NEOP|nr:putative GTP-binding protein EngB [Frankliniella fusca]
MISFYGCYNPFTSTTELSSYTACVCQVLQSLSTASLERISDFFVDWGKDASARQGVSMIVYALMQATL